MSILYPADYTPPETARVLPNGKQKESAKKIIKSFTDKPKSYDEIVKCVEKEIPNVFIGDEIVNIIKEVDLEWHPMPEPKVVSEVSEPIELKSL